MKIREQKKLDKRNLIVEAAARMFARKGFSGTVMAEIAIEAGIGKGTIYEYFNSKETLFFAVFEWFVQQSSSGVMVSFSTLSVPASKRLEAMSEALMKEWVQMKEIYSLAMEFWAASASSKIRDQFKEAFRITYIDFRSIVSALIREGIETGEFSQDTDPDAIAAALVGTWDALLLQAWFDVSFDPLHTAKQYMKVLLRGLSLREEQPDV